MMVGKPGMRRPLCGQIHLHHTFLRLEVNLGQQILQLAQPLAARRSHLGSVENDAEIVLETTLHGLVQGERERLIRDIALHDAALKTLRGWPGRLAERLRGKCLCPRVGRGDTQRNQHGGTE